MDVAGVEAEGDEDDVEDVDVDVEMPPAGTLQFDNVALCVQLKGSAQCHNATIEARRAGELVAVLHGVSIQPDQVGHNSHTCDVASSDCLPL